MAAGISRRKFVAISAAAGGLGLVPFGAQPRAELLEWTGVMLGAVATLRLHHPDRRAGKRLLERAVAEARRLERIFSLYERDSALSELNRRGVLVAPPRELVDLLGLCDRLWHQTGGAFDPTVQPLWRCYVAYFSAEGAHAEGPAPRDLDDALRLVGWPNVHFSRNRIVFGRRGMAMTLNGIAQGYITDRVIEFLRDARIDSSLVDMGEIRTLGRRTGGRPWTVALGGAQAPAIDIVDKAVATSAADGFRFDADGRCNHLFNPATGRCADPARSMTVVAPTAAAADALSTAFALMDRETIGGVLAHAPDTRLYVHTGGS